MNSKHTQPSFGWLIVFGLTLVACAAGAAGQLVTPTGSTWGTNGTVHASARTPDSAYSASMFNHLNQEFAVTLRASMIFSTVLPLNTNADSDAGFDVEPQVASDGAGNWVAVWSSDDSLGETVGVDWDILVSRSSDNGVTWAPPAALSSYAGLDDGVHDHNPAIATDRAGHWVAAWAAWQSGGSFAVASVNVSWSDDNGVTWSVPTVQTATTIVPSSHACGPQLATDRAGHWVLAFAASGTPFSGPYTPLDVYVSRSTDHGATWTESAPMNLGGLGFDYSASLEVVADGAGQWLLACNPYNDLGGTIGTDGDILIVRSTDNGVNWTAPQPLNSNAASDSALDYYPRIASDRQGQWVAIWLAENTFCVSRSTGDGASWTPSEPLVSGVAESSVGQLATDGAGHWAAVLTYRFPTQSSDSDVFIIHSTDDGTTWTAPTPLNSNAEFDAGNDYYSWLETDSAGAWLAVWGSTENVGGLLGDDSDVLMVRAGDDARVAAPSNPSTLSITASEIVWTWQDNSTDETGFNVFGVLNPALPLPLVVMGTTPANQTSWIQSVDPNAMFSFQVSATGPGGDSIRTEILSVWSLAAPPKDPWFQTESEDSATVILDTSDGNPLYTQYAIEFIPASGSKAERLWVQYDGTLGSTAAYQTAEEWGVVTVTGLSAYTNYSFSVTALNGAGVETPSEAPASGMPVACGWCLWAEAIVLALATWSYRRRFAKHRGSNFRANTP